MIKLLLYCTKAEPFIYYDSADKTFWKSLLIDKSEEYHLNGKIVAECECEKVEKWFWNGWWNCYAKNNEIDIQNIDDEDFEKSCLDLGDLIDYQKENPFLYALHLSNVKVFDEPKELAKHTLDNNSDYYVKKWIKKFDSFKGSALTKAPQNMCNVYDRFGNHYVLISIQPQHLANILNGKKTIEIRKRILNCLKELKK